MSIKNLKPKKNTNLKNGYLYYENLKNPLKYKGIFPIIYRSSLEFKFMLMLDSDKNVEYWASESFSVPYFNPSDNKYHRYYPDFIAKLKVHNGKPITVYEVKPKKQLPISKNKPIIPSKITKKAMKNYLYISKQFYINCLKYKAVTKYCQSKGWNFTYITEDYFKI
jgi:hypothetical protein